MERNRPIIIAIVIAIVLVAILGFSIAFFILSRKQAAAPTSSTVTLKMVGYKYTNLQMQPLITAYEEAHPHIFVNYTQIPQNTYNSYLTQRLTSANTSIQPDIFEAANTDEMQLQKYSQIAPSSIISAQTFKAAYFPIYDRGLLYHGNAVIGVPEDMSPLILLYNPILLTQDGYTIDNFTSSFNNFNQNLGLLAQNNNISTINIGSPAQITVAADIMQLFMLENGTQMNDSNGFYANFDSTQGEEAVAYYNSFVNGKVNDNWNNNGSETDIAKFAKGQEAFMFAYPDEIQEVLAINPTLQIGYALYPPLTKALTLAHYDYLTVSNKSPNELAAWQFIMYLNSSQSLETLANALLSGQTPNDYGIVFPQKNIPVSLPDQGLQTTLNQATPIAVDWNTAGASATTTLFNTMITSILGGNTAVDSLHEAQRSIDLNIQNAYY